MVYDLFNYYGYMFRNIETWNIKIKWMRMTGLVNF